MPNQQMPRPPFPGAYQHHRPPMALSHPSGQLPANLMPAVLHNMPPRAPLPRADPTDAAEDFLEYAVRCSLVDMLDKTVLVLMQDGKVFVGNLMTFDNYSNIVLNDTTERKSI